MACEPSKSDIQAIFKRLRSTQANKQCFDCRAQNPTWASVTYGVFLCIDCSAVHRGLGVHVTFIRSTQLDTSWTWLQLRAMQVGGNAAATLFFRQHGCTSADSQQKYHSRAAQMYREKLHAAAYKAMKLHGTKLHIDSTSSDPSSPEVKEVDFFREHEELFQTTNNSQLIVESAVVSEPISISNGNIKKTPEPMEPGVGPDVDAALSMSPTQALIEAEPRKVTIGQRKPASAKKGMGGKKGGFGAQRVKEDFSVLESEAQLRDQEQKERKDMVASQEQQSKGDDDKRLAQMKLAYKDLNLDEKKREEKMKNMDPQKKEQMERLGMGFGSSRGVSHSVMSDMQVIEQEKPSGGPSSNSFDRFSSRREDFFDDYEIIGSSSGPPKYNESPFGLRKEDRYSSWSNNSNGNGSNKNSSWDNSDRFESKQDTLIEDISSSKRQDDDRGGRSRKNFEAPSGEDAQKKFGDAKSISSDQFFGNKNPDYETKQSLSKFEGSSSISSAEFFGGGPGASGSRNTRDHNSAGPDLTEIKEGVRQGVTKVAGKLSSLANGVMSSIQDNYG